MLLKSSEIDNIQTLSLAQIASQMHFEAHARKPMLGSTDRWQIRKSAFSKLLEMVLSESLRTGATGRLNDCALSMLSR